MSATGFSPLPVTWDIQRGYDPSRAQWRSSTGLDPYQHLLNWVGNAQRNAAGLGTPLNQEQVNQLARLGVGGMWDAEATAGTPTGFNFGAYGSDIFRNTFNPGEAVQNVLHGTVPQHAGVWGTPGQGGGVPTQRQPMPGWRDPGPNQPMFGIEPWLMPGYTGPDPNSPEYREWARTHLDQTGQPPLGEGITPWDPAATGTYMPGYGPGGQIKPGGPGAFVSGGAPGQGASGAAIPALGDFLHHTLDPTQQLFYQTNPGLYWHWAGQSFAPNVNTPRADWWNNRYQQAQADYGNASVGDPNLQWADWLDKNYPQISQEFGLMGAQQRGENTPFLPAGRPQL